MTEFVELGPGKLAVTVYEPDNHIGDALLIHGYTGSKEDFSFIGPLLADEGYRVVTSDHRGQHESEHAADISHYSIESLARDHVMLAEHFQLDSPHLLGHSFGGLVAQRAAVEFPEVWSTLTILCSGPEGNLYNYGLEEDIEFLETHSMEELWNADRKTKNQGLPFYDIREKRWHMSDKYSVIRHARHLLEEKSVIDSLTTTGIPIHVIRGELDDGWPHNQQFQMAQELGAPLSIIPGAGHCPNEEYPEETAQIISQWWKKFPAKK